MSREQQLKTLLDVLETQMESLLQKYLKVFEARMEPVVQDYLKRMGEHIRDIGKLSATDVHRLVQLKRLNRNLDEVQQAIARTIAFSLGDIEQVFWELAALVYESMAVYYADGKQLPIKKNKALIRIINAQLRITKQKLVNLSRTTISSKSYQAAIDIAIQTVQTGLTNYISAIRRTIREAAVNGLRVQYPSGLTRRLDTAVRQNVLDGVRSLNQDVLTQIGEEFGADGVEITAHTLCAEDHLPYQGRQFSRERFNRIQSLLKRPFGQWNCRHTVFPILLGLSEPAFSRQELEQYRARSKERITIGDRTLTRYHWTQEQRRIETAVRHQKDIALCAKAFGDTVLRREAQRNINGLRRQYKYISEKAGLIEQAERMSVSGFRNVKASSQV